MSTLQIPELISRGATLDPEHLGLLEDSSADRHDMPTLRRRMHEKGYLLMRGLLNRDEVLEGRQEMVNRLAAKGRLKPGTDPMDAIASTDNQTGFDPELAKGNQPLMKVLYDGAMMQFWAEFFDETPLHFDFTWVRCVPPGFGAPCHADVSYMGRGTHELYTAWTPIGDVDYAQGGLMLIEGSNRNERLRKGLEHADVDAHCVNRTGNSAKDAWARGQQGNMKAPAPKLRNSIGGRWLTEEYSIGDVLFFDVFTIHASIDNHSDRIRLSTDTRYQRASQPVDERWMGENPPAHGAAGKRGRIC
jgi:Phytanoyl-CoA dioxygenase (PhyH)